MKNQKIKFAFIFLVSIILNSCGSIVYNGYEPINNDKNAIIYKKQNEFNDYTYYRHKTFFTTFSSSPLYLYVAESKENKYLRAEFRYDGSDWIFFDNATILNSEKVKMKFTFDSLNRKTNVKTSSIGVSEEFSIIINDSKAKELLNLLSSDVDGDIRIRLSGDGIKDYVLKKAHISSFIELIKFYLK